MVIPEQLRRSVAFLCYRDKEGVQRYAGTCFFLGMAPDGKAIDGHEGFFRYTITAKHVIIAIKDKSVDRKAIMRVNLKDGGVDHIETDVNDWFYDNEEPSDVAILDWAPEIGQKDSKYEITYVMYDMFQTENPPPTETIRVGDNVAIIGLFHSHTGKKRNTPIVRAGNVAMLADENEKVSTRHFGDIEAHLIESRSIGGLSGSPVYVHMTGPRIDNEGNALFVQMRYIYLFGLIHGHYDVEIPKEDGVVEDDMNREAINMGIAIVVPAKHIKQLLNHPKFMKDREDELREIEKSSLPKDD